jgi:hypothetical protein
LAELCAQSAWIAVDGVSRVEDEELEQVLILYEPVVHQEVGAETPKVALLKAQVVSVQANRDPVVNRSAQV